MRDDLRLARSEISMIAEWHSYHTTDRRLSSERAAIIRDKLQNMAPEDLQWVTVSSINQPEPQQYAFDIHQTFTAAGSPVILETGTTMQISSPDEVGVLVIVDPASPAPAYATRILDALQSAGVEAVLDKCDSPMGSRCMVMVSYKPPMKPKGAPPAHQRP